MNVSYARQVETVRKIVAIVFVACCCGIIGAARIRFAMLGVLLGVVALGCLFATFGLCIEYLARSWRESRRNRLSAHQFSLRGLLLLTALVAVVMASFRVLGDVAVGLLAVVFVVGAVILACVLETVHRSRAKLDADKPERILFF